MADEKPGGVLALVPTEILKENQQVTDLMVSLSGRANIIGPKITTLGPAQGFAFSAIQLNPNDERECYCDTKSMKATERALTKNSLDQLANMAGICWDSDRETGCRYHYLAEHQVVYTAVGWYRDCFGERRPITGEKEVDMRTPGGKDSEGMSPARLRMARMHMLSMAESKAKNRAIRSAMALKSVYKAEELARPFIVMRAVAMPDMTDPMVRRAVALHALGSTHLLYGASEVVDAEPEGDGLEHTRQLLETHREEHPHNDDVSTGPSTERQLHDSEAGADSREREPGDDDEPVDVDKGGAVAVDGHPAMLPSVRAKLLAGLPKNAGVHDQGNTEEGRRQDIEDAMGDAVEQPIVGVMRVGNQWLVSVANLPDGEVLTTTDDEMAVVLKRCAMSKGKLKARLDIDRQKSGFHTIVEILEVVNTATGEVG